MKSLCVCVLNGPPAGPLKNKDLNMCWRLLTIFFFSGLMPATKHASLPPFQSCSSSAEESSLIFLTTCMTMICWWELRATLRWLGESSDVGPVWRPRRRPNGAQRHLRRVVPLPLQSKWHSLQLFEHPFLVLKDLVLNSCHVLDLLSHVEELRVLLFDRFQVLGGKHQTSHLNSEICNWCSTPS